MLYRISNEFDMKNSQKTLAAIFIAILAAISVSCRPSSTMKTPSQAELQRVKDSLTVYYDAISPMVVKPAEGFLKYPYLIPSGFYQQMWDWDGYFMGTWFIYKGKPEYMRYWALNFLEGVADNGYVSGCVTTNGQTTASHDRHPQRRSCGSWHG